VKPSKLDGAVIVAAICLCLGGCLGQPPPVEEYLRVGADGPECGVSEPAVKTIVVAVRPFKALDNLDRQAVLVADGRVLVPSMRWYWEGSPEALLTAAVEARINCLPGVGAVSPYRPRLTHDAALSGTISAFNIQEQGGLRFLAGLRLELWSEQFGELLATTEIKAEAPISGFTAASVAEAAAAALSDAAGQAAQWIEQNQGAIPARSGVDEEAEAS